MSSHNWLAEGRAATKGNANGSLTISGIDSLMLAASDVRIDATDDILITGDDYLLIQAQSLVADSSNITIGITAAQKVGFFGATPVVQITAPTGSTTLISATAPAAATSAINSTSNTSTTVGFSSLNNFRTTIRAISNLQTRMSEVCNALSDIGIMA